MTSAAPLTLRLLRSDERPAIARHLSRLSPAQARLRFSQAPSAAALDKYVQSVDFERDGVFGAVDEATGEVVAFAQMARDMEPGCGELGVSVESGCQGLGLGKALLARALVVAEEFGLDALLIHCTHDNAPMMALGRKAKGRLMRDMGEMKFVLSIPLSLETLGRPQAMWGRWSRPQAASASQAIPVAALAAAASRARAHAAAL